MEPARFESRRAHINPRSHAVWLNHAVRLVPYVCDTVLSPVLSLKFDKAVPRTTAPGDPQLATPVEGWSVWVVRGQAAENKRFPRLFRGCVGQRSSP